MRLSENEEAQVRQAETMLNTRWVLSPPEVFDALGLIEQLARIEAAPFQPLTSNELGRIAKVRENLKRRIADRLTKTSSSHKKRAEFSSHP